MSTSIQAVGEAVRGYLLVSVLYRRLDLMRLYISTYQRVLPH